MKYTVEGFSQQVAVEYGLDGVDLIILRWFVDFMNTDKMFKVVYEGKEYNWVNYKKLLADMPILNFGSKQLSRRFKKLVDAGVLEHKTKRDKGTFSLYRIGANYQNLIGYDAPVVRNKKFNNSFNDFSMQNTYDFDELEKMLLSKKT